MAQTHRSVVPVAVSAAYTNSVSAVTVNLTTGTGSGGDAQGDILSGIENLLRPAMPMRGSVMATPI